MVEHVRQGGKPYDMRGHHIATIIEELNVLSRFRRASKGQVFEGDTANLVAETNRYYETMCRTVKGLSSSKGYNSYFESWNPGNITEQDLIIEDIKTLFVQETIDSRIEQALPILARIQQQGTAMKEANIFEAWAERLLEGTWATPNTPEQKQQLIELLSQELPVGADATNATEQLYDLFGDDELFDQLQELAETDPDADAREIVIARMTELADSGSDPDLEEVLAALEPTVPEPQAVPGPEPVAEDDELGEGIVDTVKQGVNKLTGYKVKVSPDDQVWIAGTTTGYYTGSNSREREQQTLEKLSDELKKQGIKTSEIRYTDGASNEKFTGDKYPAAWFIKVVKGQAQTVLDMLKNNKIPGYTAASPSLSYPSGKPPSYSHSQDGLGGNPKSESIEQGVAGDADNKFSVADKVEELVRYYKLFDKRGWTDLFTKLAGRKLEVAEIRREMEYASKFLDLLDSIRMRSDYRGQQDPKKDQELIDLSNQWLSLFNKATDEFKTMSGQGVAEGMVKGKYGRVLDALGLYYPRLSMEELNVPGYHKVVADKANVPVEYAAQVINDFVRANDPDEDEFDDFNDDEQRMAESAELNTMLKYAGVPVAESRVLDESGETIDHILNRFKHEVKQFEQGHDLDSDLYEALFDYYSDAGEMPYGVAKARTGDPMVWVSDKLADHLGVNEGWKGAIAGGLAGGALGSVVPGLGTLAGSALGAYAGHKLGDEGFKDPDAEYKKAQKLKQTPPVAEGPVGSVLGGLAGAALTKTPGGAMAGARLGSAVGDAMSGGEETDEGLLGAAGGAILGGMALGPLGALGGGLLGSEVGEGQHTQHGMDANARRDDYEDEKYADLTPMSFRQDPIQATTDRALKYSAQGVNKLRDLFREDEETVVENQDKFSALSGQYGHSGKLQKFDDVEQDVLARLKQLSGMIRPM